MVGKLELSKLPEIADVIGSSKEDEILCRISWGAENPSTKAAAAAVLLPGPPEK
jgi:hypothetical protein